MLMEGTCVCLCAVCVCMFVCVCVCMHMYVCVLCMGAEVPKPVICWYRCIPNWVSLFAGGDIKG